MIEKLQQYKNNLLELGIPKVSLDSCFIAGGAIRSIVLGEEVKDVDIFCYDSESLFLSIKELKEFIINPIETDNAVSFTLKDVQYQLIKVKTGTPQEVIEEFDFIMNMNYYRFDSDEIFITDKQTILEKRLEINPKCRNKLGTLTRLHKFLTRGYQIGSKLGLLELGQQLTELSPVKTFTDLEKESKLYFTFEEYNSINFVEKDSGSKFVAKYVGSAF